MLGYCKANSVFQYTCMHMFCLYKSPMNFSKTAAWQNVLNLLGLSLTITFPLLRFLCLSLFWSCYNELFSCTCCKFILRWSLSLRLIHGWSDKKQWEQESACGQLPPTLVHFFLNTHVHPFLLDVFTSSTTFFILSLHSSSPLFYLQDES